MTSKCWNLLYKAFWTPTYSYFLYFNSNQSICWDQSHYREVPRWKIFMEQELRFGLHLGRLGLAVLKKGSGPIMSNFWGCFFNVFRGKKNVAWNEVKKIFIYSFFIVSCSNRDTSPWDISVMTLVEMIEMKESFGFGFGLWT